MFTERGCLHGSCRLLSFKLFSAAAVSSSMYLKSSGLLPDGVGHCYRFNIDCRFEWLNFVIVVVLKSSFAFFSRKLSIWYSKYYRYVFWTCKYSVPTFLNMVWFNLVTSETLLLLYIIYTIVCGILLLSIISVLFFFIPFLQFVNVWFNLKLSIFNFYSVLGSVLIDLLRYFCLFLLL